MKKSELRQIIKEEIQCLTEDVFSDLDKSVKSIFGKYTPASIFRQIDMAISDLYYNKKINTSTLKRTINAVGTLQNSLTKLSNKKPE